MDGRPPHALHRVSAALCALVALTIGAGSALAADDTAPPQVRWPVGGPALATALDLGAAHWGATPCRGRVTITWRALPADVNGSSSWAFEGDDPYRRPARNSDCAIALSTVAEWDWVKLCSVVVHEVGHLDGRPHSGDPEDIMYPTYLVPAPECEGTPEPDPATAILSDYQAPAPAATAAPKPAPSPKRAAKPKRPSRAPRAARRRSR